MADEIKKEIPKENPVASKPNDGFVPIPTGQDSPKGAPAQGDSRGQRGRGGFGGQRKPGFGRGGGFGKDRPKDEFQTKLLDLARVTRVTGGGKRMSFRA
ncbi:MAG: hypothetical protein NTY04_01865, partial [Candidatus Staskawiczbacteria bacterium]|nr:hypothetical protein [Candidatus Staskawiczbacteria bacterium]